MTADRNDDIVAILRSEEMMSVEGHLVRAAVEIESLRAERDTLVNGLVQRGWMLPDGTFAQPGVGYNMTGTYRPVYTIEPEAESVFARWRAERETDGDADEAPTRARDRSRPEVAVLPGVPVNRPGGP